MIPVSPASPEPPENADPVEARRADPESPDEELPLPVGTLFLMMLYIMIMAGMWFGMYFEFLGR